MKQRFDGEKVPRPPYWGGYRLIPHIFEFWQDRPHRLHERRVFLAREDGSWDQGLLYP
jgi:pyridoxamine 5'-phosphate oxidase